VIQHTGPSKAPDSPTTSLDKRTPEQPAPISSNEREQLNLQGSNLQMPSVMATQTSEEPTASIESPALVVKRGTREFDTGVSIKVEALTLAV
jgi:hypothetical protein